MKNTIKKILLISVLSALFLSCENDEECRKDRYVVMQMGFYSATYDSTTDTTTISSLSIDSLWIHGINNDSMIYDDEESISSVSLPLRKASNQTDYEIRFNETTDTITILHQDTTQYLSLECGCIKTFVIDTVLTTNHFIDSVKINNHTVNTTDAEHIKIYH